MNIGGEPISSKFSPVLLKGLQSCNKVNNFVAPSFSQADHDLIDVESTTSLLNCDSTYLVHVTGIPWTANKMTIMRFFDDLSILNGANGIHFVVNSVYNNDAFIQLASYKDYQLALKHKHGRRFFANSAVKSKLSISFEDSYLVNQKPSKYFHSNERDRG